MPVRDLVGVGFTTPDRARDDGEGVDDDGDLAGGEEEEEVDEAGFDLGCFFLDFFCVATCVLG